MSAMSIFVGTWLFVFMFALAAVFCTSLSLSGGWSSVVDGATRFAGSLSLDTGIDFQSQEGCCFKASQSGVSGIVARSMVRSLRQISV